MILTRDDMIRSGACFDKVQDFCERHNVYAGEVDKLLGVAYKNEQSYILQAADLDGGGDGNGDGNGEGDGNGYGNGDGNGDGDGDGYGYGYGDGDGDGGIKC